MMAKKSVEHLHTKDGTVDQGTVTTGNLSDETGVERQNKYKQ